LVNPAAVNSFDFSLMMREIKLKLTLAGLVTFELAAQFALICCCSLMKFDSRAKPESKFKSNQQIKQMAANQT